MNSDRMRLEHIFDAVTKIQRFIDGYTFPDFARDEKTVSAVIREFIVIGEAANHLSDDLQTNFPDFPIYEARGMRNRMIHEYKDIDEEIVWKTCQDDLPPLKEAVKRALDSNHV